MTAVPCCLACSGERLKPIVDLGNVPVLNGVMFPERELAKAAVMGPIDLAACHDCGHASNVAFDSTLIDYDVEYDNSLHFSPTFQNYADQLAARLVATYDLRGRRIVEIGSGKGDFLATITSLCGGTGIGYDPSTMPDREIPGVRLVSDYYRPGQDVEPYALLVCRHVLEHLDDPWIILRSLRDAASAGAVHYLEVPAAEFDFSPAGMWDIVYPHVSYFSQSSLHTLLRRCGFEIAASGRSFAGQYHWVEVRAGNVDMVTSDPSAHLATLADFGQRRAKAVEQWRGYLQDRSERDEGIALWGAGSKGVGFLNAVDPELRLCVVDLNPRKWRRFLPGTGHEVIAPSALTDRNVTAVLITNPAYREEIGEQLAELGVHAEIVDV